MNEQKAIRLCLKDRDPIGFEYLVQKYREQAFFHAISWLNNHEDALDACQESFARAFGAITRLKKMEKFYPWFYVILRNCSMNILADRKKSHITNDRLSNNLQISDTVKDSDTLSDIAFLLMDLEFNNGENLSKQLCNFYLKHSGEKDDDLTYNLIKFYKIYRAYVRGKVTSFILKDSTVSTDKKTQARDTAQKYFSLSYSYISK